ncbi:MAG: branched-chain amino acid ABC transporter permease [Acidilobus sp.]
MAAASLAIYAIVVGLMEGTFFAFMALGLNLVFGVVRMVNIAHGDLIVLGGYLALVIFSGLHVSALVAFAVAFPLFFAIGVGAYYLLVPRLESSSDPEMFSFTAFFGLSMVIQALATLIFGYYPTSLPASAITPGTVYLAGHGIPKVYLVMTGLSILMLGVSYYYLQMTRLGRATRAIMQNREQALALGVNARMATIFAFAYGFALAGMVGVLAPYVIGYIYPSEDTFVTVLAFMIVIIGALGDPLSSVIGGLIFGVAYQLLEVYIPALAYPIVFLALLAIIVAKPGGILGKPQREV